jgi:hypothetical protein
MDITFFSLSFCLVMFHESQIWSPMTVENYKLYIVYTLILFNPPHLTIGSRLILTQSEFWIPKCCANSKTFTYV